MKKRNFIRLFDRKKSRIDSRIKRDYIENGIATIHCCISGYNDIINTYSAKDQESLNFDFVEFLKDTAAPIPDECPLVLNIIGDCLSADEKKIIAETIRDDFFTGSVSSKRNRNENSDFSSSWSSAQSLAGFSCG